MPEFGGHPALTVCLESLWRGRLGVLTAEHRRRDWDDRARGSGRRCAACRTGNRVGLAGACNPRTRRALCGKAELARAHGCDHTIVYTRENFTERVREITSGKGVPVVSAPPKRRARRRTLRRRLLPAPALVLPSSYGR